MTLSVSSHVHMLLQFAVIMSRFSDYGRVSKCEM